MNVFQDGMLDDVICILRRKEVVLECYTSLKLAWLWLFSPCVISPLFTCYTSLSPYFVHPLFFFLLTTFLPPPLSTIFPSQWHNSLSVWPILGVTQCWNTKNYTHSFPMKPWVGSCQIPLCTVSSAVAVTERLSEQVTERRWETGREESDRHRGTKWGEIGIFVTVNLMSLESGQPELAADGRPPQQAHGATHLCLVLKQAHTPGPEPPCRVIATRT